MKFQDIKENGGRVVKGVNTTTDVGTDAIKKQAAKFGNTVDKDGRPPTLSKKVKGSKTNVLFNLGMSEAINERSLIKNKENKKTNEDLQKEIAQPSEIYVDMDGVLADFFGEWARLMDVDHFTDINKKHDINDALQKIRDTDDFWLRLPLLPEAKKLLNLIKQIKGEYYICTSPLADDPNSEKHKRTWVEENLAFFPPKAVYVTHNKPQYATGKDGTPNILIDDYGVNIRNWEAAGGVGFKYKDHKFERTAKSIKQHMQQPVEEGLGAIAKGAVSNVKNTATAVKLIHKYYQTGLEQDAFAAIKHGWQWIKNPKMRSRIVKFVKKMATDDGLDWNQTVAHIKKNTGIDVSNVNENAVNKKQQPVEEGSVTVPARQLHDMVLKLVNDVDYNDTKTLAKIARTLGKEVFYKNDRVVLQDPDFDFYQDESLDEDFWDKAQDTADKVSNKLNAWLNKIFAVGERWWQKQVDEHELAWKEVEELLKPYAEELRDLIRDPEDFAMLLFLIKHNQSKKPFMQKVFAKIKRYGLKGAYALEKELQKRYPPRLDYRVSENFTEGYKLQLERDQEILVLHIKDTATGKRTEVRGKSGYESGNYDADDKLHQLLDKVGKSVDISQLMNGEPVGINPKHPDADRAKDATGVAYKAKESYTREELPQIKNKHLENIEHEIVFLNIDEVKPVQKERVMENFKRQVDRLVEGKYTPVVVDCDNRIVNGHHRYDAVRLMGETTIPVARIPHTLECIIENFTENKINFTMPNFDYEWGEANRYPEYRKLGKEEWIKLAKTGKVIDVNNRMANDIENTEAGEEHRYDYWDGLVKDKRDRFAKALSSGQIELPIIARYSDGQLELISGNTRLTGMMRELGKAKAWIYDVPDEIADLEENFADGKKKGKSRPGRVKRAGASCNGSVTALRKRAKNASGEKAKMYHWCANMKSGRKKK